MNPAKDINDYLREQGSPLAGKGAVFVREARKNGLDPRLLVAIAGAESAFGKNIKSGTYNPFGWGPHIPFKSWDQAISTVARGLRRGYLDEGLKTISQIGQKWAPIGAGNDPTNLNSNWARNVGRFYAQLGGQGVATTPSVTVAPSLTPAPTLNAPALPTNGPGLAGLALSNLASLTGGKPQSPTEMISGLTMAVAATPPPPPKPAAVLTAPAPTTTPTAPAETTPFKWQDWVGIPEKRSGPSRPHQPAILQFVGKAGSIAGQRLTPWGNESHSVTTVNGTRSAHADGMAADIPASGTELIRLGQAALIAAGMSPAEAAKQKGGLFNVGGYQVIFNTGIGGDHTDHLHVGIRR